MMKRLIFATFCAVLSFVPHYVIADESITDNSILDESRIEDAIEENATKEMVLHFKAGDKIPVTVKAEGELLSTVTDEKFQGTLVEVKKEFFLKYGGKNPEPLMSLDGKEYKLYSEMISGQLAVNALGTPNVSGVTIDFKALLKK